MAELAFKTHKKQIINVFNGDDSIETAFLIGSVARGEASKLSDIDFAVYWNHSFFVNHDNILKLKLALLIKLVSALEFDDIQIVTLNNCSPAVKFHALKEGIVLKETSEKIITELRYEVIRDYLDTQYIRNAINEIVKESINEET
jgi:hypothetical protein